MTKQMQPDAGGVPEAPKKITKTSLLPRKDADLETLAEAATAKWATLPALTLMWTTQPAMAQLATNYKTALSQRLKAGGDRPSQTMALKELNKKIDKAVAVVKTYLLKKYESEAAALPQYAKFGMVKQASTMQLPRDRDKRKLALPIMKAAIAAEGFGTEKYGTAFWDASITAYTDAVAAASGTVKSISTGVSAKDELRLQLEDHLDALILLVKANYPHTWQAELRAWGFLKVNY